MTHADPASSSPAPPPPMPAEPLAYATGGLPAPYVSARPWAKVVIGLSWAMAAVHVGTVWPKVETLRYWRAYDPKAEDGIAVEGAYFGMSAADLADTVLTGIFLTLWLVALVFWCMWVYRTYRNLPALGAQGLRYSPGWAVGYYFIPVLNLFRPFQVMRETWRASDVRYDGGTDWRALAAPAVVGWWWAAWLASLVVAWGSAWWWVRFEDVGAMRVASWIDLGILALDVAAVLLQIRVVRGLTQLQERRADAVGIPAAG